MGSCRDERQSALGDVRRISKNDGVGDGVVAAIEALRSLPSARIFSCILIRNT